jgi:septum formation protein
MCLGRPASKWLSVSLLRVHLLLASASPRRADLLRAAGFAIDVRPVEIDEQPLANEEASACVLRLAEAKAAVVARDFPGAAVIGADTVVVVEGRIFGKPSDDRQAADMLTELSGRSHAVLTGVSIHLGTRRVSAVERTRVWFLPLTMSEIAWYVATGEPRDKAGAYAVQGIASRFVDRIEGSYTNVVGLPVASVYRLLSELGALGPAVVDRARSSGLF